MARAIAAVAGVVAPGTDFSPVTDEEVRDRLAAAVPDWPADATTMILCTPPEGVGPTGSPEALIRFGADLHRLRAALAAEGVPSSVASAPTGGTAAATLAL